MRIAYVNTPYEPNHAGGLNVHIGQFMKNAMALGHEIWAYPCTKYPGVHTIPTARLSLVRTMRRMDALYVRVESRLPGFGVWSLPPRRLVYGFPVVVWEFNTTPEHALLHGQSEEGVHQAIQSFKHYGRGCDLAICMTRSLAERVRQDLGIRRVLVVPNGSDPELFRPDAPVVKRMTPFRGKLNVVWIGSGTEPWHDFKMLGEAAQMLWEVESGRDIVFHLIGPGLAGVVADMSPNVYCWGAEHYEKLPNWLAGMDVGLSLYRSGPTTDDGTPLKVFDYMAGGLPVVSTPQRFMIELFDQLGQSDLLVPAGDAKRLADVLVSLAGDRDRVRRLGKAGRQLVISHYNWRRAVQDTMNEMEILLRERGKVKRT